MIIYEVPLFRVLLSEVFAPTLFPALRVEGASTEQDVSVLERLSTMVCVDLHTQLVNILGDLDCALELLISIAQLVVVVRNIAAIRDVALRLSGLSIRLSIRLSLLWLHLQQPSVLLAQAYHLSVALGGGAVVVAAVLNIDGLSMLHNIFLAEPIEDFLRLLMVLATTVLGGAKGDFLQDVHRRIFHFTAFYGLPYGRLAGVH